MWPRLGGFVLYKQLFHYSVSGFLLLVFSSIPLRKHRGRKGFLVPAESWELAYIVSLEDSRVGGWAHNSDKPCRGRWLVLSELDFDREIMYTSVLSTSPWPRGLMALRGQSPGRVPSGHTFPSCPTFLGQKPN